jgi:pimeloyl-ACP methyl ester carboxylesterase
MPASERRLPSLRRGNPAPLTAAGGSRRTPLAWAALLAAALLGGCGYFRMVGDQVQGSVRGLVPAEILAVRRLGPDSNAVLCGTLQGRPPDGVAAVVLAVSESSPMLRLRAAPLVADYVRLPGEGPFQLFVPPGDYRLLVFLDEDGDHVLAPGELAGAQTRADPVSVAPDEVAAGLTVALTEPRPAGPAIRVSLQMLPQRQADPRALDFGGRIGLEAEIFERRCGALGLWQPMKFVEKLGVGVYALEPYDPGRTPVLFVHGSGGTPRDWGYLARNLDRRFQAWFFYYPSGLRLEILGGILAHRIETLQRRLGFPRLALVAHSMGGLVARAAVNLHAQQTQGDYLHVLATIATPWGGDANARWGVASTPLVVPCWQDLATGSAFLQSLHEQPLPPGLAFHLLYAYGGSRRFDAEAGDGTVALESQLDPRAEACATRLEGFDRDHTSVLTGREVAEALNALLEEETRRAAARTGAGDAVPAPALPPASAAGPISGPSPDLPWEVRRCLEGLGSWDADRQREAARRALREGMTHPAILEAAARQLAAGYRVNLADGGHIDAMAWMCNLLGQAGGEAYRGLLATVARESPSDKLRAYARRNLQKLPDG